jgi:hypothetical protein
MWLPDGWRKVGQDQDLKAKLAVLTAFGGEFPEAGDRIRYRRYKGDGVRIETAKNPRTYYWRGITPGDDGLLDAEKIRQKWWEIREIVKEKKEEKRKRKERARKRERKKQKLVEELESSYENVDDEPRRLCDEYSHANFITKAVEADVGNSRVQLGIDKNKLVIRGLSEDKLEEVLETLDDD